MGGMRKMNTPVVPSRGHLIEKSSPFKNAEEYGTEQVKGRKIQGQTYPLEGIIGVFPLKHRFKLKASTLLETILATLLIVIIFLISSVIINNLAKNAFQNNHKHIRTEMKRLGYLAQHEKITLPYFEDVDNWEISVVKEGKRNTISISAISMETQKELKTEIYAID